MHSASNILAIFFAPKIGARNGIGEIYAGICRGQFGAPDYRLWLSPQRTQPQSYPHAADIIGKYPGQYALPTFAEINLIAANCPEYFDVGDVGKSFWVGALAKYSDLCAVDSVYADSMAARFYTYHPDSSYSDWCVDDDLDNFLIGLAVRRDPVKPLSALRAALLGFVAVTGLSGVFGLRGAL
jgi:hypothetical protein